MNQTKIAILGFGTVGSGVAQVLADNHDLIRTRIGQDFCIKYILDLRDFPDSPFASLITHRCDDIIRDPEVTVVAEAMGGSHPAYDFTKACLEAGKNVITSNKEVVANFGAELLEIARAHHVAYVFEAAVGGGIPIIRPLLRDMCGNDYLSICGILNGTTNYILTRMKQDGVSFADALSAARGRRRWRRTCRMRRTASRVRCSCATGRAVRCGRTTWRCVCRPIRGRRRQPAERGDPA